MVALKCFRIRNSKEPTELHGTIARLVTVAVGNVWKEQRETERVGPAECWWGYYSFEFVVYGE